MDEKEFDCINVIPLVDVMLVLLTIVLTTSTFIAVGAIPVDLPKAENGFGGQTPSVIIEIDRQGIFYLDGSRVSLEMLQQGLRAHQPATPVMIRSDRMVVLDAFVQVMDVVKGLNFSQISLQTETSG